MAAKKPAADKAPATQSSPEAEQSPEPVSPSPAPEAANVPMPDQLPEPLATNPLPTIGRIVTFRTTGGYDTPAIVVQTEGPVPPVAQVTGHLDPPTDETRVHLVVLHADRPERAVSVEFNVEQADPDADEPKLRTWRWPERA